jgi:feruloyl esterase
MKRDRQCIGEGETVRNPFGLGAIAASLALLTSTLAPQAHAGTGDPVVACSALVGMNGGSVITSAAPITDPTTGHDFCDVKGVLGGSEHVELKLPTSGWQGQYVQEGCGDFCGVLNTTTVPIAGYVCANALNGRIATGSDDTGHTSTDPTDGSWGADDFGARVAFGRTSEHRLAQVAKAVIGRYYGRPPRYSYFDGCSTGGRQAMVLAQDYPDDFDGIIAGSPVANQTGVQMFAAWMVEHNTDAAGHQVLTQEKLPALHNAVLTACPDLADPRTCGFDPASIQCPPGTDAASCLTPAQVTAVRAFYRGPTDEHGDSMIGGGEPYGSELGWGANFVEPTADRAAPGDSPLATIALNYLKYLAYEPNPPSNYTLADVRFTDAQFARLNILGNAIYNADKPDLRAFAAHGGKLIMYHGWADQLITPFSTVDYYAAMERRIGGFQASQTFSRLYLVPGAAHCLFAPDWSTVNTADFLDAMFDWVQRGVGPGTLDAPTVDVHTFTQISDEQISPVDALAPVDVPRGGLNAPERLVPGIY